MSQEGHSEQLLFFALFYQSTPSCLKVVGGVGGPCDYCVSPSPKNWVFRFFRLGLTLESGFGACWDRGLGLGLGLDNLNSTIKNNGHTYPKRYHNQMMKHQKKSLLGPENKGLRTDQFCPVITEKRAVEKLKLMFKDV